MGWLRNLFRRQSTPSGKPPRYASDPRWSSRHFEASESNRLNEAHWDLAGSDNDLNWWLKEQLATIRSRAIYETRNNPTLAGICNTLAEDVVGPDGPTLQVLSENDTYNAALEQAWREWFAAPTFKPNVSGAQLLKLWMRNLPRCGEYLAWIDTDTRASGPVAMRLRMIHPRRLKSPSDQAYNPLNIMGVELDGDERPVRYWIACTNGKAFISGGNETVVPVPADLIVHEFLVDEEGQARGIPWFQSCLPTSADLRDYDDQVQDAARQMADSAMMFYTTSPDIPAWTSSEETTIQRRTAKMAPPGWQPWQYNSSQPPVQYPDFRSERQRDLGRPLNMPLMIVRLDSSKHNYSSARFDGQTWNRTVTGLQCWLSGTPQATGTLTRLLQIVAAEARFSVPALRSPPPQVELIWHWTPRGHVDPTKESQADTDQLTNRTASFATILRQSHGVPLDTHLRQLAQEERQIKAAGITSPPWLTPPVSPGPMGANAEPDTDDEDEPAETEEPANA